MATKSTSKPDTVTLYSSRGTKVTVSKELAGKLGGTFTKTPPKDPQPEASGDDKS